MVTTNTKVGPFSHAILSFEHANLYTSFKKNGVFPLTTFQALFLPVEQLVSLGLLVEADIATKFVPTVERDDIPATGHQLSGTFTAMGIQMSCATKAEMDDAVAACDCANNPVSIAETFLCLLSLFIMCTWQKLTLFSFLHS